MYLINGLRKSITVGYCVYNKQKAFLVATNMKNKKDSPNPLLVEKMRRYFKDNTYSKHINASKEYIYSHIKERITIEDLADSLGVSASYLSRLFKKETGISVSAYIRRQKIEMAKNLLQYSDYSVIEIANRLSFSSQSHFIQQFREVVGMTPRKYRDKHYMVHWDIEKEIKLS